MRKRWTRLRGQVEDGWTVLEAFGNAATANCPNATRFASLLNLHFHQSPSFPSLTSHWNMLVEGAS